MSDLFHESISDEWIDRIFAVMALAPWHTFQVLTKRAERMRKYFSVEGQWHRRASTILMGQRDKIVSDMPRQAAQGRSFGALTCGAHRSRVLSNVWLGVSVEDQKTADERIPLLLETPAAVRWISAEPLLGPIDLTHVDYSARLREFMRDAAGEEGAASINAPAFMQTLTGQWFDGWDRGDDGKRLDWVVVGGESGPGARPMHPSWARSLRDQCKAAGVPFFFKQWGKLLPIGEVKDGDEVVPGTAVYAQDGERLLPDCCGNDYDVESGCDAVRFKPVGKKAAGNLLDGRQHLEYPV
jgi:protein gp37